MRGKWFVISASAALLALVGLAATLLLRARSTKTQAAPTATAAIASAEIHLSGKIRPQVVINVSPPLEGAIAAFFVEVGQEVFEGQLLARIGNEGIETGRLSAQRDLESVQERVNALDSEAIAARLEASRTYADSSRARGEYDRLDKSYQRQKMLFAEGATPKLAYDKARQEFEIAQSEYRNLEQVAANAESRVQEIVKRLDAEKRTLADKTGEMESARAQSAATEVLSPVSGIIVARNGDVGQSVAPDTGDFIQIGTQLAQLEVVLDPDPPTLGRIRPGQPALVVLADLAGEGLTGSVKAIQGSQAIVAFTSPTPAVKPGMMAQVRIKMN